jgi:hypothetical protein
MSKKRKDPQGVYWLVVNERTPGQAILEAEPGYKPCKRPGSYRVMVVAVGPICAGCERVCRIPATAGLGKGDKIVVRGRK